MGIVSRFCDKLISTTVSLACLFLAFSCSPVDKINGGFKEKYGQRVEQIQSGRNPVLPNEKQVMFSSAPTEEEVARANAKDYYPYVGIANFGEKIPQNYLPSAEIYEQSKANSPTNSLPANIFEISYYTGSYPPFQRIGAEFDTIKVPEVDAYGVQTAMADKTYLLVGGGALQKTVDEISASRNEQDDEISEILISEKKQMIRKKKMAKMLEEQGNVELAMLDKDEKSQNKSDQKKPAKPATSPSDSSPKQ